MCLEAVKYCVWGEQWLPPGSSPPADLSCQVSVLTIAFLPAPKALEAPSLQEAEMGMSPSSWSSQHFGPGDHPTPTVPAAGAWKGWLCHLVLLAWGFGGCYLGAGCILAANFNCKFNLKSMIQEPDSHRCLPKLWALLQPAGTGPH